MPRTMWKGAISFGLVSIPIRVFPATEEKGVRFNQLHDKDGGRIKYQRVCAVCGEEVPFEHIVKGYEYEKDRYVILSDEDFDAVPVESSRAIDIVQFVDMAEIDPMLYKKSYYLVPEETGVKAYKLLREALSEDGRVGIAKVSFRDKEHLAALRFSGEVLVLETMFWPDEVRAADFEELDRDVNLRPQEVQMAQSLIENLTEEWDPDQFRDEYRQALLDIVEKKAAGEEIVAPEEPEPARVVDLMEALKASVDAAKKGRKPSAVQDAEEEEEKKPARKATAGKTSARKSTARKSTARRKAG
jgi:DNA end-binding protein Ku